MTVIPFASHLYSTDYKVLVGQRPLKKCKRSEFHTHTSDYAERLHWISESLFLPARWNLQLFARIIQPLPGADKDHFLWGLAIRVFCVVFTILLLPLSAIFSLTAFPLRCIDHLYRPAVSYIDSSQLAESQTPPELVLTKEKPLHVRTHNLGFVMSFMSIIGDLRPPIVRANEIVKSILNDPYQPDIIFFNEAFHEDATRILCEGIKEDYPYIIHNVAPQISGFSAGSLVASKYPINEVEFHRFDHISPPESMAPRGVLRVRLNSQRGPLLIYSAHTEALIGEKRAQARFDQLAELKEFIKADAEKTLSSMQLLLGDFNTSRVTAWGEDHLNPKGQAEEKVFERFNNYFDDLYLRDHDPLTGIRKSGNPKFLENDNRLLDEKLPEPTGSWYVGPFANPGYLLSWNMRFDRWRYDRPAPKRVHEIAMSPSTWGTSAWHSEQKADTARFDYILLPKSKNKKDCLDGRVEIRRTIVPKAAQSAPSDHLPVDGLIWST